MKWLRAVLAAVGTTALALPLGAQQRAPEAFKDVAGESWAGQAVNRLRAKDILVGYPDGHFRGRRALTRNELAATLDRVVGATAQRQGAPGPPGPRGPAGPSGPQGPPGPPAQSPAELHNLILLLREFRAGLDRLRAEAGVANSKVDVLSGAVEGARRRHARGAAEMGRRPAGHSRAARPDTPRVTPSR